MGLGQASRELYVDLPPVAALQVVRAAAADIGRLLELNDAVGTALVRTRYGFQRVKLRISVVPSGAGSKIRVEGAGDDVWGAGARKGTDKLVTALGQRVAAMQRTTPPPPPPI